MKPFLQSHSVSMIGFTLVELLVTVAVLAILLGVAAPSMREVVRDARQSQVVAPVRLAFHTARSEAVKGARQVTVCPQASDRVCGSDWMGGLMVFVDSNVAFNETLAVRDADDAILRLEDAADESFDIRVFASDDRTAGGLYEPGFIRFGADGQSNWLNGSVVVCDDRGVTAARAVNVSLSGDVRAGRKVDGVVEDAFGRPVSCP